MTTILTLTQCPNCGANIALLRKLETITVIGHNESHNPVVVCSNCGALMVRLGGMAGQLGWATDVPGGPVFFD